MEEEEEKKQQRKNSGGVPLSLNRPRREIKLASKRGSNWQERNRRIKMTYGGGTATATSSPPCRVVVRPPLPPKSTQLVELAAVRKSQIVQELEESGRISQVQQQPNCTEGVIERKQPPQTRPPMHNANLIAQRKEFFHQLSQDRLGRDGGIEKVRSELLSHQNLTHKPQLIIRQRSFRSFARTKSKL